MSVRKGDQGEGDLKVIQASKVLINYTYDRVRDTNIFPKADRWIMAKSIWDEALKARSNIVVANSIRVENATDAEKRLNLEKEAVGHLDALNSLIDTCNVLGRISDDRMEYWESLVIDTLKPLKGWLKSDRQRYKSFTNREADI